MKSLSMLMSVATAVVMFLSGCAGDRYYMPVNSATKADGSGGGQRMALVASLNSDVEGEENLTITGGNGFSIVHNRPAIQGYAGMMETHQTVTKKGVVLTSQRAIIPRRTVSTAWTAMGGFLKDAGKAVGYGVTPIVAAPVAGAIISQGAGLANTALTVP